MPHRHAMLRVEEAHPGEQRLGGNLGRLHPAPAVVVGEHDDAAVADRHQPFARPCDGDEQ